MAHYFLPGIFSRVYFSIMNRSKIRLSNVLNHYVEQKSAEIVKIVLAVFLKDAFLKKHGSNMSTLSGVKLMK